MRNNRAWRALLSIVLAIWISPARAHKPSDAYLSLSVEGVRVAGQWDIALRDLDLVAGLDADGNGEITWGEIRARRDAIVAYAFARLDILADGALCPTEATELLIDRHSDGAYAALRFAAKCPGEPVALSAHYRLLADVDPQHKGLLRLTAGKETQTAIFDPDHARQTFAVERPSVWRQFADYLVAGVEHIWQGYDHILFLLSLLLPAAVASIAGRWTPREGFRDALLDVLKIVTAFTIAHSITLALATLQIVSIPARISESAIALSVVIAAINNLHPVIRGRRWAVAGCFGLVHGFGFASALDDLGLPQAATALALGGFNLGVEAGQIAIVAAFMPLAWALRRSWLYRGAILVGGSGAIATVAALWFLERSLDISFLPIH